MAIDVSRSKLCLFDVLFGKFNRRPIVIHGPDALYAPAAVLIQDEYLTLWLTGLALSRIITIQLNITGGLLNKPIDLRGRDVVVLGQSYKHGLPAPLLCKKDFAGLKIAMHGNGVGALKVIHRHAEGFFKRLVCLEIFFNLKRNDFCIRGNHAGNRFAGFSLIITF